MNRASPKFAILYGCAIAVAVFFIGLVTGMGGTFGTNIAFSLAMGALGACVVTLMSRLAARKKGE
jgi:hypothetical protein